MSKFFSTEKIIELNKYAQGLLKREILVDWFINLSEETKQIAVNELWLFVRQAQAREEDFEQATEQAGLKSTHNPVVMLKKKGLPFHHRGYELANLKGTVLNQAFLLFLECFVIADCRRRNNEDQNTCKHWWHKDLSDEKIVKEIKSSE